MGGTEQSIGRIDYEGATETLTYVKDKNRYRAVLSYKVPNGIKQTGIDSNGNPTVETTYKWRQKTKMLSKDATTETKARKEFRSWKAQLIAQQDAAIAQAEKEQAERREAEQMKARSAAKAALTNRPKVYETLQDFVEGRSADGVTGLRTTDDYRSLIKHFECFKDVALEDLTVDMVIEWVRSENKRFAPLTVHKAFALLERMYRYECARAREQGRELNDPTASPRIKLPAKETKRGRSNTLDEEGVARTAALLRSLEQVPVVVAARIALQTGLREGEISALRWLDVDLANHTLRVNHAITRSNHKSELSKPKTKASVRRMPINVELEAVLKERRATMLEQAKAVGLTTEQFKRLYVVGTVDGKFYDPNRISRAWAVVASVLGIYCAEPDDNGQPVPLTFHGLRHSYASVVLAGGADVEAVANNLGHADVSVTLNTYATATQEGKRRAAKVMERATAPRPQAGVIQLKTGTDS